MPEYLVYYKELLKQIIALNKKIKDITGGSDISNSALQNQLNVLAENLDKLAISLSDQIQNIDANSKNIENISKDIAELEKQIEELSSEATKVTDSNTNGYIVVDGQELEVYKHPEHTSAEEQLYKVAVDDLGHVNKTTPVTKEDITALGIPSENHISKIIVANSADSLEDKASSNDAFLNLIENNEVRSSHEITGGGSTHIRAVNNKIYISSEDNDTHYDTVVANSFNSFADSSAENNSLYLNLIEENIIKHSHQIKGTGGTSVSSGGNGDIIINSPINISEFTNDAKYVTQSALDDVEAIAKGANQALSFANYQELIDTFNEIGPEENYRIGQSVMIVTLDVPDLWISKKEEAQSEYSYTTDEDFISNLEETGSVQIGYYVFSALETQKVDLSPYVEKIGFNSSDTRISGIAYGRSSQDEETSFQIATGMVPNTVVMRNGDGNIFVARPSSDGHAVNKIYLDENFVAKKDLPTKVSAFENDKGYITRTEAEETYIREDEELKDKIYGDYSTTGIVNRDTIYTTQTASYEGINLIFEQVARYTLTKDILDQSQVIVYHNFEEDEVVTLGTVIESKGDNVAYLIEGSWGNPLILIHVKNAPFTVSNLNTTFNDQGIYFSYNQSIPAYIEELNYPNIDIVTIEEALGSKVSISRKINGHRLDEDIELTAEDIGALPAGTTFPDTTYTIDATKNTNNANTFINLNDNSEGKTQVQVTGTGGTTVKTNTNGTVISIDSPTLTEEEREAWNNKLDANGWQTTKTEIFAVVDGKDVKYGLRDIQWLTEGLDTEWNKLSFDDIATKSDIPKNLKDLAEDENHKTVTAEEKEKIASASIVEKSNNNGYIKVNNANVLVYEHPTNQELTESAIYVITTDKYGHIISGTKATKKDIGLEKVENKATDTTPTENSDSYITSGGVYAAISDLATVAKTGKYSDLIDEPTDLGDFTNKAGYLKSSDISQSDYEENDNTKQSYIRNRPFYTADDNTVKKLDNKYLNLSDNSDFTGLSNTVDSNYNKTVTNISANGRTVTYTTGDGQTHTFNTQDTDTTYTNADLGQGYGVCATTASAAAKTVSLSGYKLVNGGIVGIRFVNSVGAGATLNINSTGAKSIYYQNSPLAANIIKANSTVTFIYDGSCYHILSIDFSETEVTQSNYEENNEANASYIQNRPFFDSRETITPGSKAFSIKQGNDCEGNSYTIEFCYGEGFSPINKQAILGSQVECKFLNYSAGDFITTLSESLIVDEVEGVGVTFSVGDPPSIFYIIAVFNEVGYGAFDDIWITTPGVYLSVVDGGDLAYVASISNGTLQQLDNKYINLEEHPDYANVLTDLSISGKTITYTKGDNTTGTITTQDTTYSTGTTSYSGTTKLYTSVGDNTDGTLTQDAITKELNKKVSVLIDKENHILKLL